MADREVREMPRCLERAECLEGPLCRAHEVTEDTDQTKRKWIRVRYLSQTSTNRQQEIRATAPDRHQHCHGEHDCRGLQPPWQRAEQKVMRAENRVEHEVGPECEYSECVGIDRAIQKPRQSVVERSERQRRENHADCVVHE